MLYCLCRSHSRTRLDTPAPPHANTPTLSHSVTPPRPLKYETQPNPEVRMIIGVPREIKRDEYRVAMLPVGVEELTRARHEVLIETGAGLGSGIPDAEYAEPGGQIVATAAEIYAQA